MIGLLERAKEQPIVIQIHTLLVGQPQTITDERGTWRSAIFRSPVDGPVELTQRGLAGDQVGDTANHGSPDQAVCCHPLEHYMAWNAEYGLSMPETMLGPGGIGENWTLANADESSLYVGDIFAVGDARVQISGPRFPCMKQERKVKLPGFHRRTLQTLRTGFYLRVLTPGTVQAGDALTLEARPCPDASLHAVNRCAHQTFDPVFAWRLMETPELAAGWKRILNAKLTG